jgi:hypothetical protein
MSIQIPCFMKGQILFYERKKTALMLLKRSLKLSVWLTTYLLYLVDVFFTDSRHCAPLFVHLFVWDRLHTGIFQVKQKKLARSFNFAFRYVNDLLSLNKFGDFVDRIYPIEFEIKDTTDTASYLDLHFEIDNEDRLKTKFYDIRDDFNFTSVNFPFIWSNIPP